MTDKLIVTFEFKRDLARKARVAAAMRGESRSALIRRAVLAELRRLNAQPAQMPQPQVVSQ